MANPLPVNYSLAAQTLLQLSISPSRPGRDPDPPPVGPVPVPDVPFPPHPSPLGPPGGPYPVMPEELPHK